MDWDELFSLMTLGAVSPYLTAAAADWCRKFWSRHSTGADAPS